MSAPNTRIARTAVGTACIIVVMIAFGWFALQFVPGEPRTSQPDLETGRSQAAQSSLINAESIVDVPFGKTTALKGITQGKSFLYPEEEVASWTAKERENAMNAESWRFELHELDMTVSELKAVSEKSFIEWNTHYGETLFEPINVEKKMFLVEVSVKNLTSKPAALPTFLLWSEDFIGTNDKLENGVRPNGGLTAELYGEPKEDSIPYSLPDDWNSIAPGETRTFTIPFLVYKNAFADPDAYENPDPARFCLTISDFDPPTIYRFWLG